jgi:hypothetical protein
VSEDPEDDARVRLSRALARIRNHDVDYDSVDSATQEVMREAALAETDVWLANPEFAAAWRGRWP